MVCVVFATTSTFFRELVQFFICLPFYVGESLLRVVFYDITVKVAVCKYILFVKKYREKSLREGAINNKKDRSSEFQ